MQVPVSNGGRIQVQRKRQMFAKSYEVVPVST
jgi:hypothetical protein